MVLKFKTRILTDAAQLRASAPEWRSLYERCPSATPFQSPQWVVSWAETFSPESIRVVEVRSGNTLVGLAPLLIYSRGQERVLAFMAGGISDYLDLLVDPQRESDVTFAIFQAIEELDRWTTLDLTDSRGIIAASLQAAARKFAPGLLKDPKKRRGAGRNLHARNCQRISAGFISAARYALGQRRTAWSFGRESEGVSLHSCTRVTR